MERCENRNIKHDRNTENGKYDILEGRNEMGTEKLMETENITKESETKGVGKCSENKNRNANRNGNRDGNQRTDVQMVILTNVRKASTSLYLYTEAGGGLPNWSPLSRNHQIRSQIRSTRRPGQNRNFRSQSLGRNLGWSRRSDGQRQMWRIWHRNFRNLGQSQNCQNLSQNLNLNQSRNGRKWNASWLEVLDNSWSCDQIYRSIGTNCSRNGVDILGKLVYHLPRELTLRSSVSKSSCSSQEKLVLQLDCNRFFLKPQLQFFFIRIGCSCSFLEWSMKKKPVANRF